MFGPERSTPTSRAKPPAVGARQALDLAQALDLGPAEALVWEWGLPVLALGPVQAWGSA